MKRSDLIRLICYIAALAVILLYPVGKLIQFEFPSGTPLEWRISIRAIDPYDPMRGRYVTLNLRDAEEIVVASRPDRWMRYGSPCFVILEKGSDNQAKAVDVVDSKENIPAGKYAVAAKYKRYESLQDKKTGVKHGKYYVSLPFNRYYLNEEKAPDVEKVLRYSDTRGELIVLIYPGNVYQVKDLLINGKSVRSR